MEPNTGIVKWFNEVHGYGYIQRSEGADVYVNHRDILSDGGYRLLEPGQKVSFQIELTPKGLKALRVSPVPATESE